MVRAKGGSAVSRGGAGKLRVLIIVACFLGALVAPALANAGPTIVSLTFDDGDANQYDVRPVLAQHSMHATFYINSGHVGTPGMMTWDQLAGLAADGNEIGGHTVDHVDLTTVDTSTATHQVCDDRSALIAHGFTATDFAYPSGGYDGVESIVQGCGYSSGRRSWGLCPIGDTLSQCASEPYYKKPAETIPPLDTYAIRTIQSIRAWNTLADLENVVTRAENAGGGWVPLVLHNYCDGCDATDGYSISPSIFNAFLDWLAPRVSSGMYSGTYVRTVRDVISDKTPPTSSIGCNSATCSTGWYPSATVSLSATDSETAVSAIRYTTDGSDPTSSSTLYTGPFTVSSTTTVKYRAWDMAGNVEATKSHLIQIDSIAPVSSISCDSAPCSNGTYTQPVSVALSATDTGASGIAAIRYTTDGSDPASSSTLYTGPFTVSSTTTVKYRAWDNAGNVEATNSQLIQINQSLSDTTAPTSTIACNATTCSSGWYRASVTVSLSATDPDDAVAAIRYTTDGSDPTSSSTLYTGPFSISVTTTVKYRAWDSAGNVETTKSQFIQIDTTSPTVSITSPVNGATVTGTVKIVASLADAQSGVASVAFYVDGVLIGTATNSPWQVPWNTKKSKPGQHVLTAIATDRAGNTAQSASVTLTVK
jgi:peptidoglycan/xylan/chitin deacetylase (PgdA/CDA1 family)